MDPEMTQSRTTNRKFDPDASVVLIGMRVAGKSTLASIVSKTLGWQLIDEKKNFQHVTKHSISEYINEHGLGKYCELEVELLSSILFSNEKGCVIVCSTGCVQTEAGRNLLREYGQRHPVIHIIRDANSVETYLGGRWPGDIIRLRNEQEPVYRSCSNLEFYNMADTDLPITLDSGATTHFNLRATKSDSLVLKHVERDFARFLDSGVYHRHGDHPAVKSSSQRPSSFSVEHRRFTYVLPIKFPNVTLSQQSIEELESCIDVLQFCVDPLKHFHDEIPNRPQWEYISEQYAFLRRKTNCPIIYHIAMGDDASVDDDVESAYFDLLHGGLRLGVEYMMVSLERDERKFRELVASKGSTKIIGYFHDGRPAVSGGWAGEDRRNWYLKARSLGCELVQLTQPALVLDDNEAAKCFVHRIYTSYQRSPLISAFNTGRLGRPSKIFNTTFTPVYHPALQQPQDPGAITVQQGQWGLYQSLMYEKLHFFTFGAKVQSALSPALHNAAFQAYGMPHDNRIYETDAVTELDILRLDLNFGGCSMSLPYKVPVVSMLRSMSTHARIIGAVNTILPLRSITPDPEKANRYTFDPREQHHRGGPIVALRGENTDWIGIRTCMLRYLSPANAIDSRTTALILGAGGMARAAVYAMMKANVKHVFIYNRTYDNALKLAHEFSVQNTSSLLAESNIASIDDDEGYGNNKEDGEAPVVRTLSKIMPLRSLDDPWPNGYRLPTIIVSCLPTPEQHTTTKCSSTERLVTNVHYVVPNRWMASPTGGVFLELAYNLPYVSAQLNRVNDLSNHGWIGINGLEMLLESAYVQFELWTGRVAPRTAMKKAMIDSLESRRLERESQVGQQQ
ncbi:hypothetical protein H0G86_005094 [Trichoderma simmonsii]|uniref:Quinate repressor protein n=1 Tax=Trichoderma simmonsii TaxID=1491479 RepID=A0A8G0PCQ9_9HYPO|nr:hypothetical protein H0G86_005094 [Trichoderma simmonsii]